MQYTDLHNHTTFSFDSEMTMSSIIEIARQHNISTVGFSDHLDFADGDPGSNYYSPDKQFRLFTDMSAKTDVDIYLGIEASYEDYYYDKTRNLIDSHPFDYVIMSVHFVERTVISKWIANIEEDAESVEDVDYSPYFEQMLELLETADFDILGHIDYYKKYSKFSHSNTFERYADFYGKIINRLIARDKILEINTSGLRYECAEQFPSESIIKLYRNRGGQFISTGSDSHKKEHIGFGLDRAEKLINKYNLKKYKPGV